MDKVKKVQLSPTRIIPDAITVWNKPGPEVDIVMDLHKLGFREESIDEMYSFHVLEHLFTEEIPSATENWFKCLKNKGLIYVVVNDFEFVARSFVGGDILIADVNNSFATPTQMTRDTLISSLEAGGFKSELMSVWHLDVPEKFKKSDSELVISAVKHG